MNDSLTYRKAVRKNEQGFCHIVWENVADNSIIFTSSYGTYFRKEKGKWVQFNDIFDDFNGIIDEEIIEMLNKFERKEKLEKLLK